MPNENDQNDQNSNLQGEFVIKKNTLDLPPDDPAFQDSYKVTPPEQTTNQPAPNPTQNQTSPSPVSTPAPSAPDQQKSIAHFFSNLCVWPSNVTFENQEVDEEIVLLIRRDLITNLPWIIVAVILIFIPPIISLFSAAFAPFFTPSMQVIIVALLFYYLIVAGFILVQFTIWYFNVGLITTKRVIDFNISGILFKEVSETKLDLVEDVAYSQVGSIRSLFNYGDVLLQTAATIENFEFERVPDPAKIVKIIADMIGGPR